MSYHFGTEIAQFTLKVYQPGDEIDLYEERMGRAINPETLELLEDDGNTDEWTELLPKEQSNDLFEEQRFKVLKPMWVIELQCFPQGGLDYERSEGDIRPLVSDWAVEAAKIFKAQMKPVPVYMEPATIEMFGHAIDQRRARHYGEIDSSFYGVFHSSWSGGGGDSYMGDYDYEMELEFLGELAEIAVK
jgi:hypothetical protein